MVETSHKLICADASELSFVPDSSVDLIVTSPPYPMIGMWDRFFRDRNPAVARALDAGDGPGAFHLMHEELDRIWRECFRVLVPGGWACINVGDAVRTLDGRFQLYPNHARLLSGFSALGFDVLPEVLWRKQTNAPNKFMGSGMLPGGAYVTLEHEHILVLRKGARQRVAAEARRSARRESAYFWEERNAWFSDIWDFKGTRQDLGRSELRARSAAFPFELPFRLVSMYSLRGDVVLDPFVGTGTTTLAAMACGRNSIGVDIDEAMIDACRQQAQGARSSLNDIIRHRAGAHASFIQRHTAAGGTFAYVNGPHGFPVMTAQETDLRMECIQEIRAAANGTLTVLYRPLMTGDAESPGLFPGEEGVRLPE